MTVEPLPTPPLRLRRVHLHGVGPDGARFDPLDLDFTTDGGAASRVLLSLTNTGGKSTLITLVSSLIVPAARSQVGGKNLGDFVLTGDTSHVVCEWEDATDGTRTITGTVMEWRDGRRQPGHAQRSVTGMHRAWYLFRTGPGLPGIDDLAFVTDGRRATFEHFTAAVTDLIADHPAAKGLVTRKQVEWLRAVDTRTNVDPVLFGYQMRMNDSESGAEKLLANFDSDDNVVRFFISALNDDRELSDFTTKLSAYADIAAKRPRLVALAGFGAAVGPAVSTVAARAEEAAAASRDAALARANVAEHTAALIARRDHDESMLADLAEDAAKAAQAFTDAQRDYGQISDIRQQLLLEHARWRLDDAKATLEGRKIEAAEAERNAAVWGLVDAVLDAETARKRRDVARDAYNVADQGLGPLRDRVRDAAAAFAARLDALIRDAATEADRMKDEIAGLRTRQTQARDEENGLRDAIRDLDGDLQIIEQARQAAKTAAADAVSAGWATPGETAADVLARWTAARASANSDAERHGNEALDADENFDRTSAAIDKADEALVDLRRSAQTAAERLNAYDSDIASLATDEITHIAGDAPDDVAAAERVATLADRAAADADRRAATHQAVADEARAELTHLDETGTAPAGDDVLAVLAAVRSANIGAVTGLEWIEHNVADADARAAVIETRPDVAGGVIVSDPNRFSAAVAAVTDAAPRTRTPVAVTAADVSLGRPVAGPVQAYEAARHVVVPHRATWDREWAAAAREELERQERTNAETAAAARAAARAARAASATCQDVVRRWTGSTRPALAATAATAADALETALSDRARLVERKDEFRQAAADSRAAATKAQEDERRADRFVTLSEALVEAVAAATTASEREPATTEARQRAGNDLRAVEAEQEENNTRITSLVNERGDTRGTVEALRRERRAVPAEAATTDPGGSVDVLREAWDAGRIELTTAEAGLQERVTVERMDKEFADAQSRLDGHDPALLADAAAQAETLAAASATARRDEQDRARQRAADATRAMLQAETAVDRATEDVTRAAPPSTTHQNHFDLSNTPEWQPESFADVQPIVERLDARGAELRERMNVAESDATDARVLRDEVSADVTALTDTIAMVPRFPDSPDMTGAVRYDGHRDEARKTMRLLLAEHQDADNEHRTAADALRAAIAEVRSVAVDARWQNLDEPVAIRLRTLNDEHLVAEAATLASRIEVQATSARGDLDTLDEHRTILRDGLVNLCRTQRRLLRDVSSKSKLPDGLGDLSRQATIKITFEDAPDDEAAGRLAERIDTWATELAANPKRATSTEQRHRWLTDAVRDTVVDRARAGAWSISILKPRIDGHVAHCPPNRIAEEFSGGQVLTLAVLVYCALSGVRAAHRVGGARPAGCLILDNPFGAASAEQLIEMQHRLAAHTGLQLVCATGLHDAGVDAAFSGPGSVIVKLRNDGDVRRNMSYLRLRAAIVDGIDVETGLTGGRPADGEQNWVESARYQVGQ